MRHAALITLMLAAGCSVEPPDGRFACTSHDECPAEFGCSSAGLCSRDTPRDNDGGVDGGPMDGSAPDGRTDAALDALLTDTSPDAFDASSLDASDAGAAECADFALAIESSGESSADAVAIDDDGNLYVGGFFSGALTFMGTTYTSPEGDLFVASFGRDGNPRWFYTEGGEGVDRVFSLGQLDNGELLAVGQSGVAPTRESARAFRLNLSTGELVGDFAFPSELLDHWISDVVVVNSMESYVSVNVPTLGVRLFRLNAVTETVTLFREFTGIERLNGVDTDGTTLYAAGMDVMGSLLLVVEELDRVNLSEGTVLRVGTRLNTYNDVAIDENRLAVVGRSEGRYIFRVFEDRTSLGSFADDEWEFTRAGGWNAVIFAPDARGPVAAGFQTIPAQSESRLQVGYIDAPRSDFVDMTSSLDANVSGNDIAFSSRCPQEYIVGQFDRTFAGMTSGPDRGFLLAQTR